MSFPCLHWFLSIHISWRNPLYTWVFITKIWYSCRKCYYFVYTDIWIFSCPGAVLYIYGYSLRKYDITVRSVVLMLRVMCAVVMSWHSRRKCCASCVNCCVFQWRHMNHKKSKITGHSTVCLTAYVDPHQRRINIRIAGPLWPEFTSDWWSPRMKVQWRGKSFHFMTSSCRLPRCPDAILYMHGNAFHRCRIPVEKMLVCTITCESHPFTTELDNHIRLVMLINWLRFREILFEMFLFGEFYFKI